MSEKNRGVVYLEPGRGEVQDIPDAKLDLDYQGRTRRNYVPDPIAI